MQAGAPIVFIIDDDAGIRASIQGLLKSAGLRSKSFESPRDFLGQQRPDAPSCLVLDLRLPGISGLDFQAELARRGVRIPIVFISGYGDIPTTVKAMKSGAVEFLPNPSRMRICWPQFSKPWTGTPRSAAGTAAWPNCRPAMPR